jgi:hypothetical protein
MSKFLHFRSIALTDIRRCIEAFRSVTGNLLIMSQRTKSH